MEEYVFKLQHENFIEYDKESGEEIFDTKILGFFSSLSKCKEAIDFYKTLPGFKDFPDNFCIDEITADEDCFNDEVGKFHTKVYFLCHEWYDGEYDYVSHLGYYSTMQKAEQAEERFKLEKEFLEHLEGFGIDEYVIDKLEWSEGFFSWR